jgi:hypothetical protein
MDPALAPGLKPVSPLAKGQGWQAAHTPLTFPDVSRPGQGDRLHRGELKTQVESYALSDRNLQFVPAALPAPPGLPIC